MYTYKYNHMGYTVYKNGVAVHKAGVLAKNKRYNHSDAINNKNAAEAHIRMLEAMNKLKMEAPEQ